MKIKITIIVTSFKLFQYMNQNYEMFLISAVCCLLMKFSINPFSGPNPKRLDKCAPKCKIILNIYLLTEKRIQFWISKFCKGVGQWASKWPNKSWQSQSQNHLLQNIFNLIFSAVEWDHLCDQHLLPADISVWCPAWAGGEMYQPLSPHSQGGNITSFYVNLICSQSSEHYGKISWSCIVYEPNAVCWPISPRDCHFS